MRLRADLVHDLALADHHVDERAVGRARTQFLVVTVVATALLVLLALLLVDAVGDSRASTEARTRAAVVAAVVGARMEEVGEPTEGDEFTGAVRLAAEEQAVSHVVVWRRDGTVVWADDPRLVGRTFGMHDSLQALFDSTDTLIGRPGPVDLVGTRSPTDVEDDLEVFAATTGAGAESLVVESYVVRSSLDGWRRETVGLLTPYVLATLVVVEATYLMLGLLLLRTVRRGRRGRTRITSAAIRAMETERRELAAELHDGVVQNLAATRYALGSIAASVPPGTGHHPRQELERIQEMLRDDLVDLRGLLTHLLPPDTGSSSPEGAVRALVHQLVPAPLLHTVELDLRGTTPEEVLVIHRVVREGVSNAVQHAAGSEVSVTARTREGDGTGPAYLEVVVEDDGRGPAPARRDKGPGPHHGLVLLAGLVQDHGGSLTLTGRTDGPGTRLVAVLPHRSQPTR